MEIPFNLFQSYKIYTLKDYSIENLQLAKKV